MSYPNPLPLKLEITMSQALNIGITRVESCFVYEADISQKPSPNGRMLLLTKGDRQINGDLTAGPSMNIIERAHKPLLTLLPNTDASSWLLENTDHWAPLQEPADQEILQETNQLFKIAVLNGWTCVRTIQTQIKDGNITVIPTLSVKTSNPFRKEPEHPTMLNDSDAELFFGFSRYTNNAATITYENPPQPIVADDTHKSEESYVTPNRMRELVSEKAPFHLPVSRYNTLARVYVEAPEAHAWRYGNTGIEAIEKEMERVRELYRRFEIPNNL